MPKTAVLALVLIVSMSCGIDTISYLSGNPRSISTGVSALDFAGPSIDDIASLGPDIAYLGTDFFYKIYASDTDADNDLAGITARQSATNSVPGASVSSYLLSTSGLGYSKPLLDGTIPIPLISETNLPATNDPATDYAEIDFQATPEPTISFPSSGPTSYQLLRSITSGGSYLSFYTEPVAGNADYKSNSDDTDATYYVQFFAASYGIDFGSGGITELYGDAVYLGRITINF